MTSWGRGIKAYLGSSRFLNLMIVAALVLEGALLFPSLLFLSRTDYLAAVLPGVLTELANEDRKDAKLTPLKVNPLLERAAKLKAEDMLSKGYFSHLSPDGKKPWYWLDTVGYDYLYAGENLALNFSDSAEVNKAWMNSPTHRDNILKREFREIGLGVAEGSFRGQKGIVVVQFFGTPASALGDEDLVPLQPNFYRFGPGLVRGVDFASLKSYFNRCLTSPATVVNSILSLFLILILISLLLSLLSGRKEKTYWWKVALVLALLFSLLWLNRFLVSRNLKIAELTSFGYNTSQLES